MKYTFTMTVTSITILLLSGCNSIQEAGEKFNAGLKSRLTDTTFKKSELPTQLNNIFDHHPFNSAVPFSSQYPRVAFTVLSSPPRQNETVAAYLSNISMMPKSCWKLQAKIWTNSKQSEEVPPFEACVPDIMPIQVPLKTYFDWWFNVSLLGKKPIPGDTTGTERTLGPIPPDNPFPGGVRYLEYYRSGLNVPGPSDNSAEGILWASIFFKMGFYPNYDDRRIWVSRYVFIDGGG